ncbi:hypothetical protein KKG08_00520 [Patescibacteria group bacterium]|nr:hypothetical protein [Patescibacteria group bacterium]
MIKKILLNSTLLIILLGLIGAPIGSMALMKLSEPENSVVLSVQDKREVEENNYLPDEENIPEEIEEVIRKLEEEYYQTIESTQEEELDILLP